MLKQITELERLWNKYDPVADYYGGDPIVKQMPDGSRQELGKTKPGGHYRGLVDNQKALRENFEDFKRECLKRNDNSNPGLPADVEKWVNLDIPEPTNNHTLWEDIRDWWRNLPPVPKNWPKWLPPPVPYPVPAWP